MQQLALAFDESRPLTRRPTLPYQGRTPIARACSRAAAKRASADRELKKAQYLRWLAVHGPATDHEAADHFNWPLSSICSIRNGCLDAQRRPLVVEVEKVDGPFRSPNTRWGLR